MISIVEVTSSDSSNVVSVNENLPVILSKIQIQDEMNASRTGLNLWGKIPEVLELWLGHMESFCKQTISIHRCQDSMSIGDDKQYNNQSYSKSHSFYKKEEEKKHNFHFHDILFLADNNTIV